MTARLAPRVLSIPPGADFLRTLATSLNEGRVVPDFRLDGDPLALADVTIFVPTRRAARALRGVFTELSGGGSAILPTIRPLGEFDEDEAAFEPQAEAALDLLPPIAALDRILLLAPLVRAWKRRMPAQVAALFGEEVVVPASSADAIWLARDLGRLMDEVETEGADWLKLAGLVPDELANWWRVTLDFLDIVTRYWPEALAELGRSNPAAHRSALIRLEAARLKRNPPPGPVIAAGSTGSIPATAELLSVIARLPQGAVVLPGLDDSIDERAWTAITAEKIEPSIPGHPQYGLARLLTRLGISREEVETIGALAPAMTVRARVLGEALRPAETTDDWPERRESLGDAEVTQALAGITLMEAANEHDEALGIAVALRLAVGDPGKTAALVTADRTLARRVAAELRRFGIRADDSGGTPLASTPPATLLTLAATAALEPGDPVAIVSLLKHPLLLLGHERGDVRNAAETIELVALRGGTGRPDVATLVELFETRLTGLASQSRPPFWMSRLTMRRLDAARRVIVALDEAFEPLAALRMAGETDIPAAILATTQVLEALGRGADGDLAVLYGGDAGEKLADLLRALVSAPRGFAFAPSEWPAVLNALIATETVKPSVGGDSRVAIWGALEARLQSVDTLVVGALNEGTWPARPQADRFLSRLMKGGLELEPPERRIGLAAHDFWMAAGTERLVLSRSVRSGEAPAVASRWLQRLTTFVGPKHAGAMRARGATLLGWARGLEDGVSVPFAPRPQPKPPLDARPQHFSVTEIETLRRDPYAVYAKRILALQPVEPLLRDPGAAERGTLFHEILHRFSMSGVDPHADDALHRLVDIGRSCFAEAVLPEDVVAVWWPRFEKLAANVILWERGRSGVRSRHAEARAEKLAVGDSGVTLSGYADRIDVMGENLADILDYKTGSSPSRGQAHTLLSPQLALEGALLKRGAFRELGPLDPADLAFIRLKANGEVLPESILEFNRQVKLAGDLSEEAWARLEKLLLHYRHPRTGYLSRALPFRENDVDGDYDHLARVLEWSAGGDADDEAGGE